eukprot:11940174-Heterocapsa_arctica.AAC.1
MRYIRAIEKGDWRRAAECRKAFPEIDAKVGGHNDKDIITKDQDVVVHKWILELARATISEEMEEVEKLQAEGDEYG